MSNNLGAHGGCCRCCCSFILTSGLTALFMWLSLRTSNPKCIIQEFYVPALNTTDHSNATSNNHTIFLHLRLENVMKDKGVLYDALNLTIFYGNNSRVIASHTFGGFRQGHHKKANRKELIQTDGVPWADAYKAASNNTALFGVRLATRVRFRIMFFNTKSHSWVVEPNVTVNSSGMKSGVAEHRCYPARVGLLFILFYVLTLLL